VQPLPRDVAQAVRRFIEGRPRDRVLFPGGWSAVGADVLRADLAAAGIPFVTEGGQVYDFHALRHQFITDLAGTGVHPKDARVRARPPSTTLTLARHPHVRPATLRAALEGLPSLAGEGEGKREDSPERKERRRA